MTIYLEKSFEGSVHNPEGINNLVNFRSEESLEFHFPPTILLEHISNHKSDPLSQEANKWLVVSGDISHLAAYGRKSGNELAPV